MVYGIRQFRMYGVDAQKWLQLGRWVWVCTIAHSASVASFEVSAGAACFSFFSLFLSRVHLNLQLVSLFRTCSSSHFSDSVEHDDRDHYYSSACKIQQCLPFIEIRARDGTVAQHPEATRPKSETDKSGQKN